MDVLKVTFDSNVWRVVTSPEEFPKNDDYESCKRINQAISDRQALGFLCESIFTLEAVRREGRQAFLANYQMSSDMSVQDCGGGTLKLSFSFGPDDKNQPTNTPHLNKHLAGALDLGFRIMRVPRFAAPVNPDIKDEFFATPVDFDEYTELCSSVAREIEDRGCGIAALKSIGCKYAPSDTKWIEGIRNAPPFEEKPISKAVAEWADGDSLCAHFGLGNDYFCTNDQGKSAGTASVFSSDNRAWLSNEYGIKIVSPDELAEIINSA